MATYRTDFESTTVGNTPTDWTLNRWSANCSLLVASDAGASNGKTAVFKNTGASDEHAIFTWDAVDADANRDNLDILVRWKGFSSNVDNNIARLLGRGSGNLAGRTGYAIGPSSVSAGPQRRITKYVNGAFSDILSEDWTGVAQNEWWFTRAQYSGTTLQIKTWEDGTPEPATWSLTTTDPDITAVGWVGVFIFNAQGETHVDWFSVGTNGDAAPGYPRKITVTDLKDPNAANSAIADATGVQVKLWVSSDSNDPTDTGAPDHLITDATITSGTMEATFDSFEDIGNPVLGVAKWEDSNETYFFPIDTIVTEDSSGP